MGEDRTRIDELIYLEGGEGDLKVLALVGYTIQDDNGRRELLFASPERDAKLIRQSLLSHDVAPPGTIFQ